MILLLAMIGELKGQEVDEVTLTFAYPAVGQVYVNCSFRGDQPLIGLGELLSILQIPFSRTDNQLGFKGVYPSKDDRWEIDPVNLIFFRKGERVRLKADQFYVGETDLYLSADVFFEAFDFELTVNTYGLTLSLKSPRTFPVDEKAKRQALRAQLKAENPESVLINYPMLYPRRRSLLALGMLDYTLGLGGGLGFSQMNYNLTAGVELLGGDLQGALTGFSSNGINTYNFGGLRWRYVFKGGLDPLNNPALSELTLGQVNASGPIGARLRGININNTPIVPRRVLDLFAIEGFTVPDSEVELLIAGQLVDFIRADELGYYRFTTPLSYGTVRVGIRIYTPQGEVLIEDRQLQIPFSFVPRGMVNYSVQAGYIDYSSSGNRDSLGTDLVGHANVAIGVTNNLTMRVGANYGLDSFGVIPRPYGSFSTRVFDQYLLNFDYIPTQLSRFSGSVFYSNNTSVNLQYTSYQTFQQESQLLARKNELTVNYFLPFRIGKKYSGVRMGLERVEFVSSSELRYQADFNTRLGAIVGRLNYQEQLRFGANVVSDPNRLLTATITYMVPRTPGLPVFIRGVFLRSQIKYDLKRIDATAIGNFQFSQTVWKIGRLTVGYDRDIVNKANFFQLGLLLDFQAFRSSTTAISRQSRNSADLVYSQTFNGSFGADLRNGILLPTNRDQVGRSGAAVRMFIDANSNGIFDNGEEIVPARYVKLDQSASMIMGSDGILRLTQLQSYWPYRLIVDQNGLPDASLASIKDKFSFVADPNRFKMIDIPLYKTGTIEGYVYNERTPGNLEAQPGLRLHLKREGDDESLPYIRTFSDGAFYAYGLIPGNYTLLVDSGQLAFMNVAQHPDTLKFTIRATAEGDWIDTLQIVLRPREPDSLKKDEPLTLAQLERQLGNKLRTAVQAFSEAQELFYRGRFEQAMSMTDSSLREYTTDFAIAMKGSIAFMQGDKQAANNLWAAASERNPFISLPDTNKIKLKVSTLLPDSLAMVPAPKGPADTIPPISNELLAELEAGLGDQLRQSVSFFTEAQELFYRLRFDDALSSIDSSLSYYVSDHALALKGSIVYILGRKSEAWQYWYEAQARNPHIILPDIEILDRLTMPIAEAPDRYARKKLISNRN